MPFKFDPKLKALLDQYEAARKVTRASTRKATSERFAARRPLRTRAELLKLNLKQTQTRRDKMLHDACWPGALEERSAELVYGAQWRTNGVRIASLTVALETATAALATFDKDNPP